VRGWKPETCKAPRISAVGVGPGHGSDDLRIVRPTNDIAGHVIHHGIMEVCDINDWSRILVGTDIHDAADDAVVSIQIAADIGDGDARLLQFQKWNR